MRFLYKGTVVDTLDFDGTEIYLIPEAEVELPEKIENYPYFQRLIANGILKAVSPASQVQEAK
jgi:hypothetical protein